MRHALILLALFTVAACGGHSAATPSADPGNAQIKYARCLRANGVPNFPDDPRKIPAGGLIIPDRARKACVKLAPAGKTIDANDPKTRDRFLKLARCMRAHGVDWPDPSPGSFGGPPPDLSGVKDKARVEALLKICFKPS